MERLEAKEVPACPKYTLFAFNLIALIGGLTLTVVGIVGVADDDYFIGEKFADHKIFRAGAILVIAVGSFTTFFSCLGCLGAIRESSCLLMTYAALTTLALIGVGSVAILGFVFKANIADLMREALDEKMYDYNPIDPADPNTIAWDKIQQACAKNIQCKLYETGCMEIVYKLEGHAEILAIVALVFAILMVSHNSFHSSLSFHLSGHDLAVLQVIGRYRPLCRFWA
ncbi:unnamed protein product [Darwinula stevensoni]|uniref:Tetraspanin n=1 Tax=Darwinula stevensoni TaxID=69355 RepID=A0A7R9A0R9_9CRUS|nr:unnamed protein product [Darwinula stevensoni]CAG0881836.1 unnamed protein product [Darwinula stevensoni]